MQMNILRSYKFESQSALLDAVKAFTSEGYCVSVTPVYKEAVFTDTPKLLHYELVIDNVKRKDKEDPKCDG